MTHEEAKIRLKSLRILFDEFNAHGFLEGNSKALLKVYQTNAIEGFELVKFLYAKENIEATRAYMIFCGKILLRLSHLIHNDRKETEEELTEYFRDFTKQYKILGTEVR